MVKVGHPRCLKKTREKHNLRLFEKSKGFPLFPSTKDHIYYGVGRQSKGKVGRRKGSEEEGHMCHYHIGHPLMIT
jgi:hypothetical protein